MSMAPGCGSRTRLYGWRSFGPQRGGRSTSAGSRRRGRRRYDRATQRGGVTRAEARGGGAFGVTDGTVAITGGSAELQPVPLERQQAPEVVAVLAAPHEALVSRRRRLGLGWRRRGQLRSRQLAGASVSAGTRASSESGASLTQSTR